MELRWPDLLGAVNEGQIPSQSILQPGQLESSYSATPFLKNHPKRALIMLNQGSTLGTQPPPSKSWRAAKNPTETHPR